MNPTGGIDLGAAYLAILPDTSKIAPGVRAAFGDVEKDADRSGKRAGSAFGGAVASAVKRAAPVLAAGLVVKGGLSRLLAIDDAEAKLKGLGLTGREIGGVQASIDRAVTGTAFSLSDGMTAATTAMASGVRQGKELEGYVRLIGDVATQAGAPLGDISRILDGVTARGKVGQESLNELSSRGLGVAADLQKFYGVNREGLESMLRTGKVTARDFETVLRERYGGSAQQASETVRGSFANMRTSFSRLGAIILGPVFERLPNLFMGVTASVKAFAAEGGPAARAGSVLGSALAATVATLTSFLRVIAPAAKWLWRNKEVIGALVAGYVAYRVALRAAAIAEGALALWRGRQLVLMYAVTAAQRAMNTAMRANPIGLVITALTLLAAGLIYAYKNSETFRSIVDRAWTVAKAAFADAWEAIRPIVDALGDVLSEALPIAFGILRKVAGLYLSYMAAQFRVLWTIIEPILQVIVWYLRNVLAPQFRFLWEKIVKPVFGFIARHIRLQWAIVKPVFQAIATGVDKVADAFSATRRKIASAWSKVTDAVKGPLDQAKNIINGFLDLIDKIPGVDMRFRLGTTSATTGDARRAGHGGATAFATGGAVFGPGTATSDSIAAWLSAGEHVLTARDVANLGGHEGVYALRNAAAKGLIPGFATGGAVVPGRGNQHPKSQYPWATYAGDFPNPIGTPVKAWKDGVVALVRSLTTSYGKHIRLNHDDGTSSLYAHLSSFAVQVGDLVRQGMKIGAVGSTGNSTGPHLHLETMGGHYSGSGGSIWDSIKGAGDRVGEWIKSKLLDKANIGGLFGDATGLFRHIGEGVKDKVLDRLFDSGGVASGVGLLAKGTLQPERVLSPRQTRAFEAALARDFDGGASQGRSTLHVIRADVDFDAVELLIEERIDVYDRHQDHTTRMA